jgi:hypothetical protein
MSFSITLYSNSSENNKVDKSISRLSTFTGTLRDECSIIDPLIVFEGSLATFAGANYLYIPDFKRYYFIRDITSISNTLVEVSAHVDVLMSFATGIRANRAIIRKNANEYNLYLNDGTFKCYQNPLILTKAFPSGFSTQNFVLAVAGSASD